MPPSPADWKRLFALLDSALDLAPDERQRWLDDLPADAAHLRTPLAELLEARTRAAAEDFLQPPSSLQALAPLRSSDGPSTDTPSTNTPYPSSAASHRLDDTPRAGRTIGPYRLLRELGRGGMATVWLAERADGLLQREVALKLPQVEWRGPHAERIARERSILASLAHPNIARLYDAGRDADGRPYLALEYVDGEPIDRHVAGRALALDERVRLLVQVARAVAQAHAQLVVHRDLKPSNILVDRQGQVHLLDFGIARLIDAAGGDSRDGLATRLHGPALTPDYASPEQIRGEPIGTASDVYSLGIVAYVLFTGARPYRLPTAIGAAALAEALTQVRIPPPSTRAAEPALRRQLRGDLDAIVARATRAARDERYPTMTAFADDLERHLRGEVVAARPDSPRYRAGRWLSRHRLESAVVAGIAVAIPAGAAAQAAVLVALAGGAAVALWQLRAARRQAEAARDAAARAEQVKDFALSILQSANPDAGAGAETSARDILQEARRRIDRELGTRPAIAVELGNVIADGLLGMGDLGAADEASTSALELALRELGPRHPLTVASLQVRGTVLVHRDRAGEAIALLKPAAAEARRQGLAHTLVEAERWLATVQLAGGDVDAAHASAQAAIDAIPPPDVGTHLLDGMSAWSAMVGVLSVTRRPGQVDAAQRALAFARARYGERANGATALLRVLLGRALATEIRVAEAIAELQAARLDVERFLGPRHPSLAAVDNYLGHAQLEAGDAGGAIRSFEQALEMSEREAQGRGVELSHAHASLGKALHAAGDAVAAEALFRSCIELLERPETAAGPFLRRARSNLALVVASLGRLDEAEAIAASIEPETWPVGETELAVHRGRLAVLRRLQGRYAEAIEQGRRAVAGLAAHPSPTLRAAASHALGEALLAAGKTDEAIDRLQTATDLYAGSQLVRSRARTEADAALERARAAKAIPTAPPTAMPIHVPTSIAAAPTRESD